MAVSYAHRLGQIIGESLENAIEPFLREFAGEYHLYFDKKEYRPARPGTKLTWVDINQNKHDLDFVVEKAKDFIVNINPDDISPTFRQYEAEIEYSNGDVIKVSYHNQNDMLSFLSSFV